MITNSMRGEISDIKKGDEIFSLKNSKFVKAIAKALRTEDPDDYIHISKTIEPVIINSVVSSVRK